VTALAVRTLLVWCPDWPVIAAQIVDGVSAVAPVAVLHANRVWACSPAARQLGIRRGQRKRDAQRMSPDLLIVERDPGRDAIAFEPVVAAVEEIAAGVAVLRPGVCAVAARGPARYYGGEDAAAEKIIEQIGAECDVEAQIGIAEGTFAALLAARAGKVIEPGGTPAFLAGMPVSVLERPKLVDLLRRLGVQTLGGFAALPASQVTARFGLDGMIAHRLAAGLDDRPLEIRPPPVDLEVDERFEEPVARVDVGAFAARVLAERLHERLAGHGLVCTRLAISAVTGDGTQLERIWRHDGVLTATAISDRTRWQLDGWLTRRKISGGIVAVRLTPLGVLRQTGLQPGLWGEAGPGRERAHRAMDRVQGLLGPDSVVTGVPAGGRDPASIVTLVPWGDERKPARPAGPWPGAIPAPFPARLPAAALPVRLLDADGADVAVSGRLQLSAAPARMIIDRAAVEVVEWFGPWPLDERWWDPEHGRRAVRIQVVLADGRAFLLILAAGQWTVAGSFD
jgi:protein ImuB